MGLSERRLLTTLVLVSLCYFVCSTDVFHDGRAIKINGERRVLFSGSIHYPRSTPQVNKYCTRIHICMYYIIRYYVYMDVYIYAFMCMARFFLFLSAAIKN